MFNRKADYFTLWFSYTVGFRNRLKTPLSPGKRLLRV